MEEYDEMCQNDCNLAENREMKKYPPLDTKQLLNNPFSQELVIPATKIIEGGKFFRDEDGIMLPASAIVDKEKYTRVIRTAKFRQMMMILSPTALKLLMWIIQDVEDGNDWIRIMPEFYAKQGGKGASKTQYKVALNELMDTGYITPTKFKYTYWINPAVIYAGSRINKYPDKVVIKNEWDKKAKTIEQESIE